MYKLIHKIRGKSKGVRTMITLGVSLGVTGVFALFWGISYVTYSDKILSNKNPNRAVDIWNEMSAKISDSYKNFSETQNDMQNGLAGDATESDLSATTTDDVSISATEEYASTTVGESEGGIFSDGMSGATSSSDTLNTKTANDKATTSSQVLVQ